MAFCDKLSQLGHISDKLWCTLLGNLNVPSPRSRAVVSILWAYWLFLKMCTTCNSLLQRSCIWLGYHRIFMSAHKNYHHQRLISRKHLYPRKQAKNTMAHSPVRQRLQEHSKVKRAMFRLFGIMHTTCRKACRKLSSSMVHTLVSNAHTPISKQKMQWLIKQRLQALTKVQRTVHNRRSCPRGQP